MNTNHQVDIHLRGASRFKTPLLSSDNHERTNHRPPYGDTVP
jgi:hypothetical protein